MSDSARVDLLVFGPHPDDLEIGLGGTIAKHTAMGLRVGLCDLTRGEMGTNGTPDERLREAESARAVLGAAWRENLGWPDRRFGTDPARVDEAMAFVRRHRPRVVAVPHWNDRHPDHVAASRILTEAVFNAGLRRYPGGEAWKPEWICYYAINDDVPPSFVIDVSASYEAKRKALDCYRSQFDPAAGSATAATRLNTPLFRQMIESRDAHLGAVAGVGWAEGVVVREPIVHRSLFRTDP